MYRPPSPWSEARAREDKRRCRHLDAKTVDNERQRVHRLSLFPLSRRKNRVEAKGREKVCTFSPKPGRSNQQSFHFSLPKAVSFLFSVFARSKVAPRASPVPHNAWIKWMARPPISTPPLVRSEAGRGKGRRAKRPFNDVSSTDRATSF